jgi:predicted DNA-binding transcriptional regulator AlpA
MTDLAHAADERIGGPESRAVATAERHYIDADECADRFGGISKRHWIRLVDSGRAPQPTRFGRLVRWSIASLEAWERDGCRPIRSAGKAVRV